MDQPEQPGDVVNVTVASDRVASLPSASASLLATLVAGVMLGTALTSPVRFDARAVVAGVVAAVPVAFALAGLAHVRGRVGALALVEVLVFASVLLARSAGRGTPDPLGIAMLATVAAGAVSVLARRVRPRDVVAALVAGYAAVAFMYELAIPLSHVL